MAKQPDKAEQRAVVEFFQLLDRWDREDHNLLRDEKQTSMNTDGTQDNKRNNEDN